MVRRLLKQNKSIKLRVFAIAGLVFFNVLVSMLSLSPTNTEDASVCNAASLPILSEVRYEKEFSEMQTESDFLVTLNDIDFRTNESIKYSVKKRETISSILKKFDVSACEIDSLVKGTKSSYNLKHIQVGHELSFIPNDGSVDFLRYQIDDKNFVVVTKQLDGFISEKFTIPHRIEVARYTGVIKTSLFEAASEIGLADNVILELADIFAWDIDFTWQLQPDDHFTLLVERIYSQGKFIEFGKILAAHFHNNGEIFEAYDFEKKGKNGYYDKNGNSLKKAFLKAPVKFTRISSGYRYSRKHPVLRYRRGHRAVDFAAKIGTPVKSVGDGIVTHAGWLGQAGKVVKIKHNGIYKTVYAHLNGFAKGIRKGVRVSQGQVIAYVGKTGLATGPHVHYALYRNGAAINPLRVKFPSMDPIKMVDFPFFVIKRDHYASLIEGEPTELYAKAERVRTNRITRNKK